MRKASLLSLMVSATALSTFAAEYLKVADFGSPEAVRGLFSNCRGSGSLDVSYDSERRCAVVAFDADAAFLRMPGLAEKLKALSPEVPKDAFYFKYRASELEATCVFKIEASKAIHASYLCFVPGPDLALVAIRPRFGWHQRKVPYDGRAIESVYVEFTGKGRIELYEAGVIIDPARPKVPPRDWTPVASDAFTTFPEPRMLRRTGGVIEFPPTVRLRAGDLPFSARQSFVRDLRDFHGVSCVETKGDADIVFSLKDEFFSWAAKVEHDGFAISAEPGRGVKVIAREPAGLAWGSGALSELFFRATLAAEKSGRGESARRELPAFELVDWPRSSLRIWEDALSGFGRRDRYDIPFYNEMLARVPLAGRFNLLCHYSGTYYQWTAPGFSTKDLAWSQDEYGRVVDFVNGYGADVMPFHQSLGHQDYFMLRTPELAARYGEDGERGVLCTRNPETYPLLFSMFDDVIRSCSRNRKPKYFFLGLDEVRWTTHKVAESNRCVRCAGIPKNQIFRDHVRKCRDWLNERGLRPVMSPDMITEMHNGRNRFNCAAIVDELPRDVILAPWSKLDDLSIDDLDKKGFEQWKVYTGFTVDPTGDDRVTGYGIGLFVFNWWLTRTRGCSNARYGILAQFLTAHHAWREAPLEEDEGIPLAHKWGNFLMRRWGRKPVPFGAFRTIPLVGKAQLPGGFDSRTKEVDGVPVDLCGMVVAAKQPTVLPVVGRVLSFAFLHGVEIPERDTTRFYKGLRDDIRGNTLAAFLVKYADGAETEIPINYAWNVGEVVSRGTNLEDCLARYLFDCRFVWTNNDDDRCLYLTEWINPTPEKEIVSVSLRKVGNGAAEYRLYSLSAKE